MLPVLLQKITKIEGLWFGDGGSYPCGVALDTIKELESQMLMRHYKGF